jgi:hypothetical protein
MADLQFQFPILATQTYQPDGALVKQFRDTIFIVALYPSRTKGANNRRADAEKRKKLREKLPKMMEFQKPPADGY